ncbi:hypothetical protein JCM10449v2_002176 [Rhodotorula kratochvilovae]
MAQQSHPASISIKGAAAAASRLTTSAAGWTGQPAQSGTSSSTGQHVKQEDRGGIIDGMAQNYLPTPSPAPPAAPSLTATALAKRDSTLGNADEMQEDAVKESDCDSLSSADTDMADAADVSSNRATPLFPPATTFRSRKAFFTKCQTALLRAFGVPTHIYRDEPLRLVARCRRRQRERCPFAVCATKEGDEWALADEACVWEHSHDVEGTEEERAAVSSDESGGEGRGEQDTAAEGSEEEDDESGLEAAVQASSSAGPWSAKTSSALMKRLVASRESIFAKQCAAQDATRAAASQRAVDAFIAKLSKGNTVPRSAFRNYTRFCAAQQIPLYPLTPALLALWMLDKCSTADGYFRTYKQNLARYMDVVKRHWEGSQAYEELLALDAGGDAIDELVSERYQPPGAPRGKRKRADSSSAMSSGASDEDSSSSEDASGNSDDDGEADDELLRKSASSDPIDVPGLPRTTDTFPSAKAAYQAFVRALVPVFGVSLLRNESSSTAQLRCGQYRPRGNTAHAGACPFLVALVEDDTTGRWGIDGDASTFEHSHGPRIEILRDPNWRSEVRNADAREALGMPPRAGPAWRMRDEGKDEEGQEGKGKGKRVETSSEQQKPSSSAAGPSKKPRAMPAAKPFLAKPPAGSSLSQQHPSASSSRTSPGSLPPQAPFAGAPARANAVASTSAVSTGIPAPSPPSTIVSAFLRSLHPSLEPLTMYLVTAGFDSPAALTSLVLLDPPILDLTLDLVRLAAESPRACPAGTSGPLSAIQLKMLARLLKEAGEEARASGG